MSAACAELVLLSRAREGDRSAIAALATRLLPAVRRAAALFARRMRGERTAEELASEAWLALSVDRFAGLAAWSPERGASLETFAVRIALGAWRNLARAVRAVKRGGRALRVDESTAYVMPDLATPEALVMSSRAGVAVWAALEAQLPPKGLLVLRLHFTDGHPVARVAAAMGVRPQVVYNWVFRIRAIARATLATHH
jgi:RNA polymerase sigma factor (sigma-70 family)